MHAEGSPCVCTRRLFRGRLAGCLVAVNVNLFVGTLMERERRHESEAELSYALNIFVIRAH